MTRPTALPAFGAGPGPPRPPFAEVVPSIVLALGYAAALLTWLAFGDLLPGGRTFAVHLFTLGVLTNLILALSEHFSRTVTRIPGERSWWWVVATNLGIVLVLAGVASGVAPMTGLGATGLVAVALLAMRHLRRLRVRSIGARLGWLVRAYERSHGAFVVGALLGGVLGIGLVGGSWYASVRIAHLHANLLGWGGLTLLATLVFLGPTMARTRIEAGADVRAAADLRYAAAGLAVGVALLLVTGATGGWATLAGAGAAVGLGVYAFAATRTCLAVRRAVVAAPATASGPLLRGVCAWFVVVVWLDVVVVAVGARRWLDALGVALLAGVLAQAIGATLTYLAPLLRGRTTARREALKGRLEVGARTRAAVLNLGVVLAVVGAARPPTDLPVLGAGWGLVAAAVLTTLATALWPLRPR